MSFVGLQIVSESEEAASHNMTCKGIVASCHGFFSITVYTPISCETLQALCSTLPCLSMQSLWENLSLLIPGCR